MNDIKSREGTQRCFRVYFEPVRAVESFVKIREFFGNASIFMGSSVFEEGPWERLAVAEIHTDSDSNKVAALAEELRALNGQRYVRVTYHNVGVWDVRSPV